MPANRRRSAATAPYDRWVLLGSQLELRRRTLGHTYRKTFERDHGVNTRLAADIEKAAKERVNTFMPGTLQLIARGYAVTYESVLAVLRGEADDLVPAAVPPAPPDEAPPLDPARAASDRTYFDEIQGRLGLLRARGTPNPSGRQLFPDAPDDAKAWDGIGARLDIDARVWFIADLRRRAAGRDGDSGTGATSALSRGRAAARRGA
jgi:hypothetical protein